MRLLIVTFDPPQNVGGVEGRVTGYVRELKKRGDSVEVEALAPGYGFSEDDYNGARLHKCPSGMRALIPSIRYTVKLMGARSIDSVFLLSGGITVFGNVLLLYSRMRRKRTAILLYGKDVLQARKSRMGRMLLLGSLWLTNSIATNSRFTASLLPPMFRARSELLYPSVNPDSPQTTGPKGSTEYHRILFVGRLVKRKGADDLIQAFKRILPDIPNARLEIVGNGPERDGLIELVMALGLEDKVTFHGTLTGPPLYRMYQECDFVAMPSRTMKDDVEGFGTVFLEAGLMGRPSIGTYSGGIPEAVTDKVTGLLVEEGNIDELATALGILISDDNLREKLGRNARSRVLRDFTWEVTATRLEEILRA